MKETLVDEMLRKKKEMAELQKLREQQQAEREAWIKERAEEAATPPKVAPRPSDAEIIARAKAL